MFSLVEKTQGDLSTQRKAVELKLLLQHSVSTRMLTGTTLLFAAFGVRGSIRGSGSVASRRGLQRRLCAKHVSIHISAAMGCQPGKCAGFGFFAKYMSLHL